MHDFVCQKSCLTNLTEFFEEMAKRIDERRIVDIVNMDFRKSFDKVPNNRLLQLSQT